jgi:hypothetical protein
MHPAETKLAPVEAQCVPVEDGVAWTAALEGVPHSIVHTWGYTRAIWLSARRPTYLYVDETADARVACPLAEREFAGRPDVVTPYGVGGFVGSGAPAGFAARWRTFALRRGYVCGYVGLHPLFYRVDWYDPAEVVVEKTLFVLDLRRTERELFDALSANRRRQLRRAEARPGTPLVEDRDAVAEFLTTRYAEFMDRRRAAPIYRFSAETMRALCNLDNVLLVGAGGVGGVEAAVMLGFTPSGGDYLFGVSLPGGERHSTRLLWWGAMMLRQRGVPWFNLGGGVREGDHLGEFKRRFAGTPLPLRALRQVFRPRDYAVLCRRAGVDTAAAYFPAYHAPR